MHTTMLFGANSNTRSGTRQQRMLLACAVVAALFVEPAQAQVAFTVSFDASANVLTSPEKANVTSHIVEAGKRWSSTLLISGPRFIEIRVSIENISTANGASTTTGFVGVIGGRDTYEQGVASELRTGIDLNGATQDGNIAFGLSYLRTELWFDPDPAARTSPVPVGQTDAMSVALHEIGHVLAYNGWADLNTGQPPATFWSTFDRWMLPGQPTLFSGPAVVSTWSSMPDLTIGNIQHWANSAQVTQAPEQARCNMQETIWANGAPVPRRCEAPLSIDAPRSMDPYGSDLPNGGGDLLMQLMNGVVFFRGTRYDISPLDIAVLRDLGLPVDRLFKNGFEP